MLTTEVRQWLGEAWLVAGKKSVERGRGAADVDGSIKRIFGLKGGGGGNQRDKVSFRK